MENIAGPAVILSAEKERTHRDQHGGRHLPERAAVRRVRESGKKLARRRSDLSGQALSHGLHYTDIGAAGEYKTIYEAAPLSTLGAPAASDLPDLPARDTWANVRRVGR